MHQLRPNRWTRRQKLAIAATCCTVICSTSILTALAQEPRFRLRNIPQRVMERARQRGETPPSPPATPTSVKSADNSNPAEPPQVPSPGPGAVPESLTDDLGTRMTPAIVAGTAVEAATSVRAPEMALADTAAQQQPIVLATDSEKSQKIAEDWPRPWACLFVTGRQHGYIEPCGCTGLENQKGGLMRRDALLTQIRERGWDVIPIDAGNQVRRFGPQAMLKFQATNNALKEMGYGAAGLGPDDLKLPSIDLLVQLTDIKGAYDSHFTSANVDVLTNEAPQAFRVIELPSGRKIGVTSVLGESFAKNVQQGEITIGEAVEALQQVAKQIDAQKCDYNVLITQADLDETRLLAKEVPFFDMIVTAGGHGEPLYKPEPVANTPTSIVQVGVKGMYVGLVGLYDDADEPVRYQRLALSSQFSDSERMVKIFAEYQRQLQDAGFEGLGITQLSHPKSTQKFVGSQACQECHAEAYEVWENSPHAHATDSIVQPPARESIARHFDPECISCHVTGWNAQQYYPYRTGYSSLEKTPHLVGNGCENCHGPASEHVAFELGELADADDALGRSLREELHMELETAREKCLECHDLDNSPAFHKDGAFEEYWQQIAH